MQMRYKTNFDALDIQSVNYLATALGRIYTHFVPAQGGPYESGEELFHHVESCQLDHADVVMSLSRDASPMGVRVIEQLIRPHEITREAPKQPEQPKPKRKRATTAPRKSGVRDPRVIVSVAPNPKRAGSASHARYEKYETGITVDEALARGVSRADVKWDEERGFIKLEASA